MPVAQHMRALRATLLVAAMIGVPLAFAVDGMRSDASRGLILSHLPSPGSASYLSLKRAAGDPSGEPLEMTGAEMWSVPLERHGRAQASGSRAWRFRHGARRQVEPRLTADGSGGRP